MPRLRLFLQGRQTQSHVGVVSQTGAEFAGRYSRPDGLRQRIGEAHVEPIIAEIAPRVIFLPTFRLLVLSLAVPSASRLSRSAIKERDTCCGSTERVCPVWFQQKSRRFGREGGEPRVVASLHALQGSPTRVVEMMQ